MWLQLRRVNRKTSLREQRRDSPQLRNIICYTFSFPCHQVITRQHKLRTASLAARCQPRSVSRHLKYKPSLVHAHGHRQRPLPVGAMISYLRRHRVDLLRGPRVGVRWVALALPTMLGLSFWLGKLFKKVLRVTPVRDVLPWKTFPSHEMMVDVVEALIDDA